MSSENEITVNDLSLRELEEFFSSIAYRYFEQVIKQRIELIRDELETKAAGITDVKFKQGECQGLRFVIDVLPNLTKQDMEQLQQMKEQERTND